MVQEPERGYITAPPDRDDDVAAARRAYQAAAVEPPSTTRPTGWRGFAHRYGWRAYALPVLVVVTVIALMTAGQSGHKPSARTGAAPASAPAQAARSSASMPPTAAGNAQLKTDTAGAGSLNTALPADALPSGGPYTAQGAGTYRVLAGTTPVIGHGTVHRYDIEVENGVTGIDLNQFAKMVDTTLADPRSWTGHNSGVALQRVATSAQADFHITLTSSITVRGLCGYSIPIETSCWDPNTNRVVLNNSRWVRGDPAYIGDLDAYRLYMINHEDGHALGHQHAHQCLNNGLAPAMMQQTIGLKSTTGQLCQANPWPYPPGAADAPGAEAPDTAQNSQFGLQNS